MATEVHATAIVEAGATPLFVHLIDSPKDDIKEQVCPSVRLSVCVSVAREILETCY